MAATELENLDALKAVLADLAQWTSWTGLGTTILRAARIGIPELTDTDSLPAMTIELATGRRTNIAATASSANFRPSGQFLVTVFALDVESDGSLATRWRTFADKFFTLIDELIVAAHDTIIVNSVTYPETPIHRDPVNVFHADDDNADAIDDSTTQPVWTGSFLVGWGGPPA